MKSGTRKKKNESKRNRGGLDMAQKALAEYEEIQRRRYHERLRAEKKEEPMEITPESDDERRLLEAVARICADAVRDVEGVAWELTHDADGKPEIRTYPRGATFESRTNVNQLIGVVLFHRAMLDIADVVPFDGLSADRIVELLNTPDAFGMRPMAPGPDPEIEDTPFIPRFQLYVSLESEFASLAEPTWNEVGHTYELGLAMNEMTRTEAIAIIDEIHGQYVELLRTTRCPSCEQILTWRDVDKHPQHEMHEAISGQEASGYLEWTSTHLPDCSFMTRYQQIPLLAAKHHIVLAAKELEVPMQDGSGKVMRDFVPVRVPAPGDPPVPE